MQASSPGRHSQPQFAPQVGHVTRRQLQPLLNQLGLRGVRELLEISPMRSARMLLAISQGTLPPSALIEHVDVTHGVTDATTVVASPLIALRALDENSARIFAQAGIHTIGDLAQLGQQLDAAIISDAAANGFHEPPSAPAELLPGLIGAVATSVRFSTFIRDRELRGLKYSVLKDSLVPLPISVLHKAPASLAEAFVNHKTAVFNLGYMCDHRQRWINLGTHLGEVVHSVALAPGESRNIALVNWRRRQLTSVEEHTTTKERITATFVQNRALHEITSAVAREHQSGQTQTESNTAVTSSAFTAAGAIVGGIAGGVTGAVIGGIVGSSVPGLGTAVGAGAGGSVGSIVGGAAGSIAGGFVYAGSRALGVIEADTAGDRQIVADVQQRISLSTSQTASAVRSLWSTAVVEDAQAEAVEASTSNITNYNHMHTLNLEYFEVLQHYLARIDLERVQPLLYLPFTCLDFTDFRFVRDYWDAVRLHVHDAGLRAQGDAYFVTEGEPERPDLLPVLEEPVAPGSLGDVRLESLKVDVLFKSLPFNTNVNLDVLRRDVEISGEETDNGVPSNDLDGYDWGNRYAFDDIEEAENISALNLSRSQFFDAELKYRIRVHRGKLVVGRNRKEHDLRGTVIASNKTIKAGDQRQVFRINWDPASGLEADNAQGLAEYNRKLAEYEAILAENASRQAAYEALVESIGRFKERLKRYILQRRHFFTRIILNAVEPEELAQLLEALTIGPDEDSRVPISALAHTIPIGMTAGALVLKLKRLDGISHLIGRPGVERKLPSLIEMLKYADETLQAFDKLRKAGVHHAEHVYVPTGGLFAEAILGRANSAEFIDMARYFNWQDSPIPHQPPPIQAIGTESRFQRADAEIHVPAGNLQVINPVGVPDPTGLQGVLSAIQNGNLFRDMSKSGDLAAMISSLSNLAGQVAQAAAGMTGQAAQQAMQSATEIGRTASTLAGSLASNVSAQAGQAFSTITQQGAALNQANAASSTGGAANTSGADDGSIRPPDTARPTLGTANSGTSEEIVRKAAGLPPQSNQARARMLNVRLTIKSLNGAGIVFSALAGIRKTFQLFHERDLRAVFDETPGSAEAGMQQMQRLIDPTYTFSLPGWAESNAVLTCELGFPGMVFNGTSNIDIGPTATLLMVDVQISAREQTITRSRETSRTQTTVELIQTKFNVSATVAKLIADTTFGASFESTDSQTDTDSVTGTVGSTITETVKVPTGALTLNVQFRD